MRLISMSMDDGDSGIDVMDDEFTSMIELRADMRKNPDEYSEGRAYSLMEERPWLQITETKTVKVEEVS